MAYVPTVTENEGGNRERTFDIYSRLLKDRIILIGRPIDDVVANLVVAQLIYLSADDPEKEIQIYVNSPGGSVSAGFAFRRRFRGDTVTFYMAIASLIVPGLVLSIGVLVTFRYLGLPAAWYSSALGAHLSWTLPFGLLIMFAVLGRLDPSYEEAARDLGAGRWQAVRWVVIPIVLPGMIAVALFGFTLSYDEFPRSWLTVGSKNTLPLEIWTMTTNVTSPALYALGAMTTFVSFIAIGLALTSIVLIQRRRSGRI